MSVFASYTQIIMKSSIPICNSMSVMRNFPTHIWHFYSWFLSKDKPSLLFFDLTTAILNSPELYANFNQEFNRLLPIALYYDHHDEQVQKKLGDQISKFYFGEQRLIEKTHQNLTNVSIKMTSKNNIAKLQFVFYFIFGLRP